MTRYLIINADDFGYAQGVNRGIVAAYEHGVVLSTSLMVDMPMAEEAAHLARRHTGLGVGLHFTATNQAGPLFDLSDITMVTKELQRQYRRCCDLFGRPPTHLDSHHHVHLRQELKPFFIDWAGERSLHLRDTGGARYNGAFYGQWYDAEWNFHFAPDFISIENLEKILRKLPDGVTELACHPAYLTGDLDSSYATEREIELATLLNPRVGELVSELDITLGNFATLPRR
ncbi:MAG: ChbG/HpnK family deacetylase [Deltaproteobacteria bacterium]|nr:ChbG/HpnK family deacetylase [Deltaproteobacteria bacterium]